MAAAAVSAAPLLPTRPALRDGRHLQAAQKGISLRFTGAAPPRVPLRETPFRAQGAQLEGLSLRLPGSSAPELAALFLPRAAPPGAYQLTVLDEPIEAARDRLRRELAAGAAEKDPPGAWTVKRAEPVVAFGEAGLYNRARLSRLFTGRPAQLVRAPISRDGRVVASLTLISPCPNGDLTQLTPRTLAILFVVDEARKAR